MQIPESLVPRQTPVTDSRWQTGNQSANVGDLWVTAWDGKDLGLVLIVAVRDSHVVIWPVTDETSTPSAPCFRVTADWLAYDLVGWPEAEAGLSYATLSRRLGTVADSRTLLSIWNSLRTDEPADGVETYPEDESEAADNALARVCNWATVLGRLDFPDPDDLAGVLRPDFADAHHISPRDLVGVVDGVPAVLRQIVDGTRLLPDRAIVTLSERFNVDPQQVVQPVGGLEVDALRAPQRKETVVSLAARRGQRENDVRLNAWQQSQLAARQQHNTNERAAAAARVDNALAALGDDTD